MEQVTYGAVFFFCILASVLLAQMSVNIARIANTLEECEEESDQ
jgi:hypothetical protein